MKWIKKLFYITLAITLISVSVNMFLGPHSIAAGGITGLAIIFEEMFGLARSVVILAFNIIILIVTYIFLGREIFFNTAIGSMLLPIFIGIIPHKTLVESTMLSMIAGSVIFGIAVSVLYNNKASSGGTAVPPLILQKYLKINPAIGLFLTDGIVVILSLFVFSIDSFFYAIFSIFITSATMKYLESGINKKKMVYIISDMSEEILNDVLHKVGRGVTILPAIGGYSRNDHNMLMVTLDRRDYAQVIDIVNQHDKEAFMITDVVSEVHGQGFTYESGSI
ncbi:MAG: YitT family protein [Oscillospiraceae bacterium]|nr:YitT family protein [Oscillospiraceae bacterium]